MDATVPIIEFRDITKRFGTYTANDHINLKIYPGEVHALLGENGAGKTTLMNILYGMYRPDEGCVLKNGTPLRINSPHDAIRAGIGMVHQHYMLVDVYSSAENVFLMGAEPWWALKWDKSIEQELEKIAKEYGLEVDVHSPVGKLPISTQQRVEILKLLYIGADVLVLDEPTSFSTPQEVDMLFETIERLIGHGKSVIFISHKLEEVLRISQRITVLSMGKVCGQMLRKDADKHKLVRMMIGEDMEPPVFESRKIPPEERKALMQIEDLYARDDRGAETLNGISLTLNSGEIVGIAALEGNGQAELAEVISGVRPASAGRVLMEGTPLSTEDAVAFIEAGVSYVPADRIEVGCVKDHPLYENWILRKRRPPKRLGLLDYGRIKRETAQAIQAFDVRTTGINARTGNLSGGNMQKFILARELDKAPKVLICSYPTRGLDIKATWFIRKTIKESRNKGLGVLLFSGELDELFSISDRIIVLYKGKIVGEVCPEQVDAYEVGRMMMGVKQA